MCSVVGDAAAGGRGFEPGEPGGEEGGWVEEGGQEGVHCGWCDFGRLE